MNEELPWELTEQIVCLLPPTLVKLFMERYGTEHSFMDAVILRTRWVSINKDHHNYAKEKHAYTDYNWVEDLCYYGDRYFLEYAINNFHRYLDLFNAESIKNPYMIVLTSSMHRLPYTSYEPIKDRIKAEWTALTPDEKSPYVEAIVDGPGPTFEWILHNIFSKDDNVVNVFYYPHGNKTKLKRSKRLLKYGNFIAPEARQSWYLSFGMIRCDVVYETFMTRVHVTSAEQLSAVMKMCRGSTIIIENSQEVLYRRLTMPSGSICMNFYPSNIYLRYTADTIRYIKSICSHGCILDKILQSSYETSVKAFRHIALLYHRCGIPIRLSKIVCRYQSAVMSCMKYHNNPYMPHIVRSNNICYLGHSYV